MRIYNVLNLGAGWQSSRILLGACRGELPKFDVAIFADTRFEPKAVYEHLQWLQGECVRAGIPVAVRSKGDLKQDSIDFRQHRKSSDGKRYASIPFFVRGKGGKLGRIKRQCTKEYKIEVVELFLRRELLGLRSRKRIPRGVLVRQWFGISADEPQRAVFPGRYAEKTAATMQDLNTGELIQIKKKIWRPAPWKEHVYPLLGQVWLATREIVESAMLSRPEQREDVGDWLRSHYPERTVPRSACIACPFRSNREWRAMRAENPAEWEEACAFDEAMRAADSLGQTQRRKQVGLPYVHRQLVPLRMADLDGDGEKGGGCGTLYDGQDGMCDV